MSTFSQRVQLGPLFTTGAINGAAKLYHYEAGTSTLKNIWSDRGMTTPLAQPFLSDADGMWNFFADGLYKIVLSASDDTVLYTLDNWQFIDRTDPTFGEGTVISSASTIAVGQEVFAHISGSTNISTLTGTIPFFWAVFDGNLTLVHSASLLLPDAQNYKVRTGEVIFFLNEGAGVWRLAGRWLPSKQTDIASASSITAPTTGSLVDITGTTDIDSIANSFDGHSFIGRFTNASSCNINHSAGLVAPWGRDYRTVQNELIQFVQVASSTWTFYSLNGPKERVGQAVIIESANAPAGFLARDGTAVSRTTYSGLFSEIGVTHGVGDGSTTFNVPDGRGRVDLQVDGAANRITSASTNGANADTLGGVGGAETHTLTVAESKSLSFGFRGTGNAGSNNVLTVNNVATALIEATEASTGTIDTTGGGGAHSNTQPWIATNKYIRF